MMLNRLTYGAAAVIALLLVICSDAVISDTSAAGHWADLCRKGTLLPVLFAMLAFGGAVELARMMKAAGLRPHVRWSVCWCVALVLAPWLISGVLLSRYPSDLSGSEWQLAAVALALAGTALAVLPRREVSGGLADLAATWAIIVYAGFLPSFALQLRCHQFLHGPEGAGLILIFLAVVKVSDIGAFFIGSAVGKHKLVPWISPNKTVEGAIGGILCSITVSLLFWFAFDWTQPPIAPPAVTDPQAGPVSNGRVSLLYVMTGLFHQLTVPQVIVFGILMSVSGQLGDLLESSFKRAAGATDSARLLPAFGGVLDIIDSPVLAAPVAWFLLTCLWPVI